MIWNSIVWGYSQSTPEITTLIDHPTGRYGFSSTFELQEYVMVVF
jgi:hypothetical protein